MNKHTDIRQKALALLLALCLLLPVIAVAAQPWQETETPYGAKLRAGTVFYTDSELTEEQGTLLMDAQVLVNEIRGKAAAISYTASKETKNAWVEGKNLILLNIATPTDLNGLIGNEDVVLMPPAAPETTEEPDELPAEEPTEQPTEMPADESAEETIGEPTEEPDENPDEELTEEASEEEPAEEPAEEPTGESAEEPHENPVEEENENPEEELAEEPSEKEQAEVSEEPAEDLTEELSEESGTAEELTADISEEETEAPAGEPVPGETEELEEYATGSLEEAEAEDIIITEAELQTLSEEGVQPETSSVYVMEEDRLVASLYQPIAADTLPEARNQNPFGTCWAFAAVGAMEIDLIKDNKANSSIDLSEFFVAYFSAHNYPYPKEGGEGDSVSVTINDKYKNTKNYLDMGGLSDMAYHILASLIGTTTEAANPYPANRSEAEKLPSDYTNIAAQITGAYNLNTTDADQIKKQIQEHGSVKVSIYAINSTSNYNTVVPVKKDDGTVVGNVGYNSSTAALYGTYTKTNHDVLLVGWDDNYSRENFLAELRPSSNGAWKARNSWGTGFGQNGYFWISYEDKSLGKATSFDAENNKDNIADFCYSYDKTYSPTGIAEYTNQAVIKQSFTVSAQEKLLSVGVEVYSGNMNITAIVRANGQEVSRSDTRKAEYSGFYNLKLKTAYVTQQETVMEVEVTCTAASSDGLVSIPYQRGGFGKVSGDYGSYDYKADYGVSGGFTINGTHVDGDSTIKLYTKKNSSNGLVSKITLNKTEKVYINSGESFDLKADKIEPSNATNKTLQWYTSDEYVARLVEDKDGVKVIGGKKGGTAVITAMSTNRVYANCTVEVTPQNVPVTAIKIKKYNNDSHTFTINESTVGGFKIGDRLILEAELTPWNTTQTDLTWTSKNPSVMRITRVTGNTCEVLVLKNGTAEINVTSDDNSSKFNYITFTVDLPVRVSDVYLNYTSYGLWEGDSVQLKATVLPTDADDRYLTWTSSKPEVATVTQTGLVTAQKDGTAVITVTTRDGGFTSSCDVLVATRDPVEAFVYRMYRVCLLREPDEEGLQHWVYHLKEGILTGSEVVYGFYTSPEMHNRNLSNADFVERCYEGIMGRASDSAGKNHWIKNLGDGMSRKSIISGFTASREFGELCAYYGIDRGSYQSDEARDKNEGITGFVSRLYTKMLGRGYDTEGLNHWCAIILDKPTKDTVLNVSLDGFMHSTEFTEKNLSDMEFVKILYRTFLGREYDAPGLENWVQHLASGVSRDQVAAGFAYSQEFAQIMASYGL